MSLSGTIYANRQAQINICAMKLQALDISWEDYRMNCPTNWELKIGLTSVRQKKM